MEPFTAYTSSSSSSSSNFLQVRNVQKIEPTAKQEFPTCSHLHSVRKPPAKPWKKPVIAPMPPARPRVYKVDAMNFRDLVQKLTGSAEFQASRLQNMAPPPLEISRRQPSGADEVAALSPVKLDKVAGEDDCFLELNLSPFTQNWCSFPLLSPETLAVMDAI